MCRDALGRLCLELEFPSISISRDQPIAQTTNIGSNSDRKERKTSSIGINLSDYRPTLWALRYCRSPALSISTLCHKFTEAPTMQNMQLNFGNALLATGKHSQLPPHRIIGFSEDAGCCRGCRSAAGSSCPNHFQRTFGWLRMCSRKI